MGASVIVTFFMLSGIPGCVILKVSVSATRGCGFLMMESCRTGSHGRMLGTAIGPSPAIQSLRSENQGTLNWRHTRMV